MGWVIDASRALGRGPVGVHLGDVLDVLGHVSHMALAGVYMLIIARFLRLWAGMRGDRRLSEPFRQLSALLCFCALAHAGDAVAGYLVEHRLLTPSSVLAAVFASVAAWKVGRTAWEANVAEGPALRRFVGAGAGVEGASAGAAPPREGPEWVHLRVARLEDLASRNAWLLQRREAVARLDLLLTGVPEPPAPDARAATARRAAGEGAEPGNAACRA